MLVVALGALASTPRRPVQAQGHARRGPLEVGRVRRVGHRLEHPLRRLVAVPVLLQNLRWIFASIHRGQRYRRTCSGEGPALQGPQRLGERECRPWSPLIECVSNDTVDESRPRAAQQQLHVTVICLVWSGTDEFVAEFRDELGRDYHADRVVSQLNDFSQSLLFREFCNGL